MSILVKGVTAEYAPQSFENTRRLGRPLNNFFYGYRMPVGCGPYGHIKVDLGSYWNRDGLRLPAGHTAIYAISRGVFKYPLLHVQTTLTKRVNGDLRYIGLENGSASLTGLVALYITDAFYFRIAGGTGYQSLLVTDAIPADYATVKHYYVQKLNKCNAEFFVKPPGVDALELKAIWLFDLSEDIPTWNNVSPYSLGGIKGTLASEFSVFLEIYTAPEQAVDLYLPMDIEGQLNSIICQEGDPLPPRQYALYTENSTTKWNGLATAGAVLTSHPVPVWRYPTKTLVFQADAAGNLDIQVYVGGGWKSWVPGGITLVANQLEVYNLNGDIPIARCVYTPTNADTITLAEWYLS